MFVDGREALAFSFQDISYYAELVLERLVKTDSLVKADITDTTTYITLGDTSTDPVTKDPAVVAGEGMKFTGSK